MIANQNAQKLLFTSLVKLISSYIIFSCTKEWLSDKYSIQITIIYNKFYLRGARDVAKDELRMFCFTVEPRYFELG